MTWTLVTFEEGGLWGVRGSSAIREASFSMSASHASDQDAQDAGSAWVARYEASLDVAQTEGTTFQIGGG